VSVRLTDDPMPNSDTYAIVVIGLQAEPEETIEGTKMFLIHPNNDVHQLINDRARKPRMYTYCLAV
jgi:hypothetical protein